MLSDEERKAIKEIRSFNQYNWELNNLKTKKFAKPYFNSLDTVLNLIEKQSKEIEGLKEDNKKKSIVIIEYQDLYEKLQDKIKAKIEELEKLQKEFPNNDEIRIKIIQRLEAKPYTAYTLYGDILHESDEIAQMLKEIYNFEKE